MPAQALENRIVDLLVTTLQAIGTPASSWLTQPTVAEGVPADAVPRATKPLVYVRNVLTGPTPGQEAGTSSHTLRVTVLVVVLATTVRTVNNVKADILRALFAAEQTFTDAFKQPMWPADFEVLDDMKSAGYIIGHLQLFMDVYLDHADAP